MTAVFPDKKIGVGIEPEGDRQMTVDAHRRRGDTGGKILPRGVVDRPRGAATAPVLLSRSMNSVNGLRLGSISVINGASVFAFLAPVDCPSKVCTLVFRIHGSNSPGGHEQRDDWAVAR